MLTFEELIGNRFFRWGILGAGIVPRVGAQLFPIWGAENRHPRGHRFL